MTGTVKTDIYLNNFILIHCNFGQSFPYECYLKAFTLTPTPSVSYHTLLNLLYHICQPTSLRPFLHGQVINLSSLLVTPVKSSVKWVTAVRPSGRRTAKNMLLIAHRGLKDEILMHDLFICKRTSSSTELLIFYLCRQQITQSWTLHSHYTETFWLSMPNVVYRKEWKHSACQLLIDH